MSELGDTDLAAVLGAFARSGRRSFTLRHGATRLRLAVPAAVETVVVHAPCVGHFEQVATVGEVVEAGAQLGAVVTLSRRFDVPAPRAGAVARALVADGDFVGHGAPLFEIEAGT